MSNTKPILSGTAKAALLILIVGLMAVIVTLLRHNPASEMTDNETSMIQRMEQSGLTATATQSLGYTHPIISINTQRGPVVIELYPTQAPKTVADLTSLVKSGYYDADTVMETRPGLGFVISKIGNSARPFEFTDDVNRLTSRRGSVAVSKSSTSHAYLNNIFIGFNAQPDLEKYYTIIGHVIDGIDVGEQAKSATLYKVAGIRLLDDSSNTETTAGSSGG